MKKRILALILVLAAVLSLAGCGGTSASTFTSDSSDEEDAAFTPRLDTNEEVTVNIVGPLNNFEALEAVISDFEEIYPNCQVLYSYLDIGMLGARLSSDPSVGIFMLTNYRYQEWQDKSYFANLLEEDIDLSALREDSINASTVDGKLFGLPAAQNTTGLIVNVDLLKSVGLEVPTNYSEFLEACQVLKEQGYAPLQGFDTYDDGYSYLNKNLLSAMYHVLLIEQLESGEDMTAFYQGEEGSAAFLEPVFERFADLLAGGYIDSEVNAKYTDSYNDVILRFFEGDVPFVVTTAETYSGTKKRETKSEAYQENSFEYEFICAPLADDGAYTYMETWWNFCLNDKSENREWALEFLRFLATEEEMNQLASIKGLPSAAENSTDERYADIYPEDESLLRYEGYVIPTAVEDAISSILEEMKAGEVELSGAVEEFERLMRESDTSE